MPLKTTPNHIKFGEVYLGIDPGASGGLCLLDGSDSVAIKMPDTERDVWDWLCDVPIKRAFAVIEKVGGYIGTPQPGSAMFKFGQSVGGLRMALIGAMIPFEEITPQRWQNGLGIVKRAKDESKGQFKNRLKQRAQQLHPRLNVTLATADAILIATYCQRKRQGGLQ